MAAALNQFIEFGNHRALVSGKLVDQHRVVKEVRAASPARCLDDIQRESRMRITEQLNVLLF